MSNTQTIEEKIRSQIGTNPIVLYMKGTPQIPQCGFSAQTVQTLAGYGRKFAFVNVLEHPEIRATLPGISNWPTFPQLFINGELVGGCDIVGEMHTSGELKTMLDAVPADQA